MTNVGVKSSTGATITVTNSLTNITSTLNSMIVPTFSGDSGTTSNNTAIGYGTMSSENIWHTSSNNTVIGAFAFNSNSLSQGVYRQNTFIGYNVQPINGLLTNQIVLGTDTETTYIPGALRVLKDVSLNQSLWVTGDVSFNRRVYIGEDSILNKRLFVNGNVTVNQNLTVNGSLSAVFANNSIQSGAISGLVDYVKSAMEVAKASGSVSSVTADILPFDGEYNFGTVWSQVANTSGSGSRSWTSIAMSLTGEYQTAVDYGPSFNVTTGGYIYTSNDFGNTWKQRSVQQTWIAVAMSTSGQYQTASYATGTTPGYMYISSSYGVWWNQSPGSPNVTVNSLAIASQGDIQYASVNGGFFLASSSYGNNWYQTTPSGNASGLWQTIACSSSGQFICFAGSGTYIYTSIDKGVTIVQAGTVSANWNSCSVSYSGQFMIVSAGAYTSSNTIVKLGSSGTSSIPGNLYMSSNFGSSFLL